MALSRVTYNTSGYTYAVPFGFLSREHLEVYLDDVLKTVITDYTIASGGGSIIFKVAGVPTEPDGDVILIKRVTPTDPYVDFGDASRVTEANLDNALAQALYVAEETADEVASKLGLDSGSTYWDADSKQIKDVDDPTLAQDAATKAYVDEVVAINNGLPLPVDPTDDGKFLKADGGEYVLETSAVVIALADITDIGARGIAIAQAATNSVAQGAFGATAVGKALIIAADEAAGRTAINAALQYTPVALTSSASITINCTLGEYFTLTAAHTFTLENPTNPTNGKRILLRILQDGTGSRVMTLGTKFRFGTDLTAAVLTTTINKTDYLGFVYDSTADKWDVIAFVKGY